MSDDAGHLHIDDDWKSQAAREKQKLQESEARTADQESGPPGGVLPEACFANLVVGLHAQAAAALGLIEDPISGEHRPDREQAKYVIDLLGVLEEKTAGNLTDEEQALLNATLYELRMSFLRM